tara:strand:+ start:446 stop:1015 length:570 start_codon:yes stop_codon:yes gene_type:complete
MFDKFVFTLILPILLTGCAFAPQEIQVASSQPLVNFSDVTNESVGKVARWGGVILGLSKQDDSTSVLVSQYPLLHSGQPTYRPQSGGTFTAKFNNSMDIESLQQGSVLTIIGNVEHLQTPETSLDTAQVATIKTSHFYVWEGLSSANHPDLEDNNPAVIQRGKWGWQVKSEKEKKRERQERQNERASQY